MCLHSTGYFSQWPEGSKILLRRTKNNMPAMILYKYGEGYVIATTLYTDYSYAQGSITEDELSLIRDIITWCKNPKDFTESKPNEEIKIEIKIENLTDRDSDKIKIEIKDGGGNIVKEETIPYPLTPSSSITYNYTFTAPTTLGIYSIYYELYIDAGLINQAPTINQAPNT